MAKAKCIRCGEECCTCNGCNPKNFVGGVCPSCIKKQKNAESSNNGMQGMQQPQTVAETIRLFSPELLT